MKYAGEIGLLIHLLFFFSEEASPKPLVVTRNYSKGKIVWMNSGDKWDHGPKSILEPERNLIKLLKSSIEWVTPN